MGDWELLLHWLSHKGEGTWAAFRRAVGILSPEDDDLSGRSRILRLGLSDLGHAEFFVGGSQRWRVFAPVLGGLATGRRAVLFGGRTPRLVERVQKAADRNGCRVEEEVRWDGPACLLVTGAGEEFAAAAEAAGLPFVARYSAFVCQSVKPVPEVVEEAPREPAPRNWTVRWFDMSRCGWVEGHPPSGVACEYSPRHGAKKYYLRLGRDRLLRLPKRFSIYAAAMRHGVQLVDYDPAEGVLSAPGSAPLPEAYARAACVCSGWPSRFDAGSGRTLYEGVPPETGAFLLAAAGQPQPRRGVVEGLVEVRCG